MRNFNFSVIKNKIDRIFPGCQEDYLFNGYYSNVYTSTGNWPTQWTIVYDNYGVTITVDDQSQNYHTIHKTRISHKDILKGGNVSLHWECTYVYDAYDADANCVDASYMQNVTI